MGLYEFRRVNSVRNSNDLVRRGKKQRTKSTTTAIQPIENNIDISLSKNCKLTVTKIPLTRIEKRYVTVKNTPDLMKTAKAIKVAFRKCHTFFASNDDEDIELLRKKFLNWQNKVKKFQPLPTSLSVEVDFLGFL